MKFFQYQTAEDISEKDIDALKRHLCIHDQDYFPNLSSRDTDVDGFLQEWRARHGSVMALWEDDRIIASIGVWRENSEIIYVDWLNVPPRLRMTRMLFRLIKLGHFRESEIAKTQYAIARTWVGNKTVIHLMKKFGFRETHRIFGELCPERVSLYYEGNWNTVERALERLTPKKDSYKRVNDNLWVNKSNVNTYVEKNAPLVPSFII